MGKTQQQSTNSASDPKKKRRVAIAPIDAGVEANDCIQIYLVSSKEEAEAADGFRIDPIDLNQYFDQEGKIYGYQGLQIVVLVSSISFHAYVDITYESTSDRGKGITDLKTALQDMFGENIVEKKDDFLQTFSTEKQCISSVLSKGVIVLQNMSSGGSEVSKSNLSADSPDVEVVRLVMGEMSAGLLYSRLVPLVLLVDGSNPIDVTDSSWEIFVIVQKLTDKHGDQLSKLLGFSALYRFYHYPDSSRLRLSQILVLPPYQNKGYGRRLLETLNHVAISEDVYDLSIEEPVESLQLIRSRIDIPRLLACKSVQNVVDVAASLLKESNLSKRTETSQLLPPPAVIDEVRRTLKINKKQFIQCWEILIYLALDPIDKYMENYRIFITDRVKANVFGRGLETKGKRLIDTQNEFGEDCFVMFKSLDGEDTPIEVEGDPKNQEEQLQLLVDERIKVIKSVAQKVSP